MRYINSDKAPAALGPYSQAVEANGILYCSGQIPIIPSTGEIIVGDIAKATKQVLLNLSEVIKEGGTSIDRVVKATIFIKNMDDFATINGVYEEFFGTHRPARAVVEVARLPKDVEIEIEAIVVKGD